MVKHLLSSEGGVGDAGSIPELGRSPGVGNGNPLQHSCLENSIGREAWQAMSMGLQRDRNDNTHVRTHTIP